jgi:hypothetical protein
MASYIRDGGKLVLLGAATVEQTGLIAGNTYEFTAVGGTALLRWGADDATIADGGFDFALSPGNTIKAVCPAGDSAINIIEAEAGTTATAAVLIAQVQGY